MPVLMQPLRYLLKNASDPLFFVCLTNKNAAFGEVVSDPLVFALPGEEGSRHEGNIIQPCAEGCFWRWGATGLGLDMMRTYGRLGRAGGSVEVSPKR